MKENPPEFPAEKFPEVQNVGKIKNKSNLVVKETNAFIVKWFKNVVKTSINKVRK